MGRFSLGMTSKKFEFFPSTDHIFGCCGIEVIYDIEDYPLPEVRANKDFIIEQLKSRTEPNSCNFALVVISINEQMKRIWTPILKAAGFKMVSKGKNNNNRGNPVYLWVKEVNKICSKPQNKAKK